MSDAKTPEEHKKKLIRAKVNNALRDGRMKKPKCCFICKKRTSKLQFHHEKYINGKPHGHFICASCHAKLTNNHKRKISKD